MTRRIPILLTACALAACTPKGPTPDELAGQAAKVYYEHLIAGRYADYVDGFHQADSLPSSYREQLVANAKMFARTQQEEHGGIDSVHLVRATADTARHAAQAYLMLCYGNREREEIVVPMVEVHGTWMMR